MRALAVFHRHGNHWADPLLHPDFRHVFAAVETERGWITVDGKDGLPEIRIAAPAGYDMAKWYRECGFRVAEVTARKAPRAPFALANCVGLVKAVLGIRAPWAVTPYQLHLWLQRTSA